VSAGSFDGFSVCYLTFEYRERETWAAELVRNLNWFFVKETLAVTFYQETNTSFFGFDIFRRSFGSTGAKLAIRRAGSV
ncbi:hypothetical protein B0E45_00125, partial [Sinorhizobium sp. A49]|uniref:hypothetical protein n=1 Tax=Sinorhizobium sp. A49 TaxID=1945861 RepID=UPI0009D262BA